MLIAPKKYWAERKAQRQAKREAGSELSTLRKYAELDETLSESETQVLDEATAANIGLGLNASNNIGPTSAIPCTPRIIRRESPPGRTGRQAPVIKVTADVDVRFVDNPIGVGSYKSFESKVDGKNLSPKAPNLSPTSTRFSAASATTLNEEEDECDACPPICEEAKHFEPYRGPKEYDWAKGKRKGRRNNHGNPQVESIKDFLTHVEPDNHNLFQMISKMSSLSKFKRVLH